MATTAIWDIKGWIGEVIQYAENPDKTANPDYMTEVMEGAMQDGVARGLVKVLDYATADFKTEQRFFVTGINCKPDIARQIMTRTKRLWRKEGGIVAFHAYQSFKPGEVTPPQAHEIGVELANRLWGKRFEVVVATHLNTRCIHNHFVLNSVSFKDGKRYYDNKENYYLMRSVSDTICKEHRLSVIDKPQSHGKHYAEWRAEHEGERTWRTAIREDVDKAIMASMTWSAFLHSLKEQGYEIKTGVKHIAVRPPGKERFVRLRSLGDSYTEEAIKQRILKQREPAYPPQPKPKKVLRVKVYGDFRLSKITWKGLRALYYFYLRKLREARKQPEGYASYLLRDDLRQLDRINEQTKFLFRNKLDTLEQLSQYRKATKVQVGALETKRTELNNEKRRIGTPPERLKEIEVMTKEITAQLKVLRRDVRLCEQIAERSTEITEKKKRLKEKEMMIKASVREKEYMHLGHENAFR